MSLKEYDYIKGNTVFAPGKKIEELHEQKEKQDKEIKERKKLQRERREKTKSFISIVLVMAILGFITLSIDSYVYKIQKDLLILELDIKDEISVNEAVKVDLLKVSSLENINNIAINQLDMIYPNKSNIINIDMSKDYFTHLEEENEEDIQNLDNNN